MEMYKYIYWRPEMDVNKVQDGKMSAYLHFIVGGKQGTLLDYLEMAENFRKTFPEASNEKIFATRIVKSSRFNGYLILIWNTRIEIKNYPNWLEREYKKIEYLWK